MPELNDVLSALLQPVQALFEKGVPAEVLMDAVAQTAKKACLADGATLYQATSNKSLEFKVLYSQRLDFHMGGTSRHSIPFADIPLYTADGSPNTRMAVACAAVQRKILRIDDLYKTQVFDLSGTREFDQLLGYRTRSMLVAPMLCDGHLVGVLQVINKTHMGEVQEFDGQDEMALAHLANVFAPWFSTANASIIPAR